MALNVQLPQYSMFAKTPVYSGISAKIDGAQENTLVFGLLVDIVIPADSDRLYTVPPGQAGRLDLISQQFYSTPDLWWVISRCNNIADPMLAPAGNALLRIPTLERLAQLGVLS